MVEGDGKIEESFKNESERRTGVRCKRYQKAVRCTLLDVSSWSTEKKYMRRYWGIFDIFRN